MKSIMNVVLVEPEIPQNTGNIGRLCAGTNSNLHIVKPMGFSTDSKYLKRAGLDYWEFINVYYYENINEFLEKHGDKRLFLATTKTENIYSDVKYESGDFLVFGKETKGLPDWMINRYRSSCITIPIIGNVRSFNLANSVSMILMETLRQNNFGRSKNV